LLDDVREVVPTQKFVIILTLLASFSKATRSRDPLHVFRHYVTYMPYQSPKPCKLE